MVMRLTSDEVWFMWCMFVGSGNLMFGVTDVMRADVNVLTYLSLILGPIMLMWAAVTWFGPIRRQNP